MISYRVDAFHNGIHKKAYFYTKQVAKNFAENYKKENPMYSVFLLERQHVVGRYDVREEIV